MYKSAAKFLQRMKEHGWAIGKTGNPLGKTKSSLADSKPSRHGKKKIKPKTSQLSSKKLPWFTCDICGTYVRQDRLAEHVRYTHKQNGTDGRSPQSTNRPDRTAAAPAHGGQRERERIAQILSKIEGLRAPKTVVAAKPATSKSLRKCPHCGANVRFTRLSKHMAKVHDKYKSKAKSQTGRLVLEYEGMEPWIVQGGLPSLGKRW